MRRSLARRFGYRLRNYRTLVGLAFDGTLGVSKVRATAFAVSGGKIPLFQGGGPEPTMTTTAAVSGGRLVMVSGDRSIATAAASSLKVVGVAKQDASAVGDKISIATTGVWMINAQGAVAAGDQVVASADGLGRVSTLPAAAAATLADINNARAVVGKALAAAIDGADCPILLTFA